MAIQAVEDELHQRAKAEILGCLQLLLNRGSAHRLGLPAIAIGKVHFLRCDLEAGAGDLDQEVHPGRVLHIAIRHLEVDPLEVFGVRDWRSPCVRHSGDHRVPLATEGLKVPVGDRALEVEDAFGGAPLREHLPVVLHPP